MLTTIFSSLSDTDQRAISVIDSSHAARLSTSESATGRSSSATGGFSAGRARADYGHWELDTVVSGRGKAKACFVTLAERKSRFYKAIKAPNRRADVVANLAIGYLKGFPPELVKTITTDNGTEFSDWERIEGELGCQVYFCDTFCAWQKGSNENANGLLREFFPKGYNLSGYTQAYIDKKVDLINNRPRKCNNWISPAKLMSEAISGCCTYDYNLQ